MFYLKHPQHGEMVVYSESDVVKHEGLGWVRNYHDKKLPEVVIEVQPPSVVVTFAEPVKKKPGRPKKGE